MYKLIVVFFFITGTLFSQSNNDKARAYFNQAKSAYSSSNYTQTIEYLNSAEQLLGSTNPVILNLKVKAYYNLKQYDKAKKSLSKFSKVSSKADSGLVDETLAYIIKIDDAIAKEKANKEKARLAEIKRIEDARIAEIRRKEKARLDEIRRKEQARKLKEQEIFKQQERIKKLKKHFKKNIDKNSIITLVPYKENDKWGFINIDGEFVIPKSYDEVKMFQNNGLAAVKIGNKWGFIDKKGNSITPIKYLGTSYFSNGLATVKINPYVGYINEKGVEVIRPQYLDAFPFYGDFAVIRSWLGELGYINKTGEIIFSSKKFESLKLKTQEGLFGVRIKGKWGFVNAKGKQVVPNKYEDVGSFRQGFTYAKKKGKYGLINTKGAVVLPFEYGESEEAIKMLMKTKEWKSTIKKLYKDNIMVQNQTTSSMVIKNIKFDVVQQLTEITIKCIKKCKIISNLSPPNLNSSYKIVDNNGQEYKLIKQSGWNGNLKDGFGARQSNKNKLFEFKLYFDYIDKKHIKSFDLIEGNCVSYYLGCWSYFGVKVLEDKKK
uniref:WG repeat-containing protein n=1 Tax=uncultured Polaribacter sp. TaxID=174711 RepID=UPI00260C40C9|nr:WG repeat-containing protein [uncultured Polaribacter sp.]